MSVFQKALLQVWYIPQNDFHLAVCLCPVCSCRWLIFHLQIYNFNHHLLDRDYFYSAWFTYKYMCKTWMRLKVLYRNIGFHLYWLKFVLPSLINVSVHVSNGKLKVLHLLKRFSTAINTKIVFILLPSETEILQINNLRFSAFYLLFIISLLLGPAGNGLDIVFKFWQNRPK